MMELRDTQRIATTVEKVVGTVTRDGRIVTTAWAAHSATAAVAAVVAADGCSARGIFV
jgi:hypothetical protein